MVSPLRREAAFRVINEMPLRVWIQVETLARRARYHNFQATNYEMGCYLKEARAKGVVEWQRAGHKSEWRRIT